MSLPVALLCWISLGAAPEAPGERIFQGGLSPEWQDLGWAPRELPPHAPARVDFSGHAAWVLARAGLSGSFTGLSFRYRPPPGAGSFLEVRVDSTHEGAFPRVAVTAPYVQRLPDGWLQVRIPMAELNPQGAPFDRVVLRASGAVSSKPVELDDIGLTGGAAPVEPPAKAALAPPAPAPLSKRRRAPVPPAPVPDVAPVPPLAEEPVSPPPLLGAAESPAPAPPSLALTPARTEDWKPMPVATVESTPKRGRPRYGWAYAGGFALAGLGVGIGLGVEAEQSRSELLSQVHSGPDAQRLHDQAASMATGANVAYAVAGTAAVVAVVLAVLGNDTR